ncbi:hypothetical protein PLICRDRAFT_176650 [Plicaturopsis crispa FD-325 SS-3]|nr:hypothetical protein PLICRDRAFT_176650 [Plicaturopsis crispa FD-325 SS-3]
MVFGLSSSTPRFELLSRLRGHTGAVIALSASECGILASGGHDGVKLWNLRTYTSIPALSGEEELHEPVSSLIWLRFNDPRRHVLLYGTAFGAVVAWRVGRKIVQLFAKRLVRGHEIIAFSATPGSKRLALAASNGTLQVWTIDESMHMECVFSVKVDMIPKSISFDQGGQRVRAFGLLNGLVLTICSQSGDIVQIQTIPKRPIGHVAVDNDRDRFIVDNASDGFDMFTLSDAQFIRKFYTGKATVRFPKQVVFSADGRLVIGGSDRGSVHVFRVEDGEDIAVLRHSQRDMVQTVTSYVDGAGQNLFIAASSTAGSPGDITVWGNLTWWPRCLKRLRDILQAMAGLASTAALMTRIVVICSACAFFYQCMPLAVSSRGRLVLTLAKRRAVDWALDALYSLRDD